MNYQETIEYLFNSTPVFEKVGASAYKEGLFNTEELDRHFDHPHRKFKTIHVAGTNGKGSCSHTLAAILQSAGYKVGLYTSPHLVDFRERIRINGKCIDEQYVVDFVEQERDFFEPLHPSFFELTTALAFKYFAEKEVDIAVIEVGLGGRLDCTNIITPLLSVITNISFDHTQFLGNTLAKIAAEKAGIIKSNVPVVIGECCDETREVFEAKAKAVNAPIVFAEDSKEVFGYSLEENDVMRYKTKTYGIIKGELCGDYQRKNTNTVLNAVNQLRKLGIIKNTDCVTTGFANVCESTGLLGRWQTLCKTPLTICDTGHNVAGWNYLCQQIVRQKGKTKRIVFGMVDDKDVTHVMAMLPKDAVYYFCKATTHRAITEDKIQKIGEECGLHGTCYSSVEAAYKAACKDATIEDFIFIGGSSYVVADLLTYLENNN